MGSVRRCDKGCDTAKGTRCQCWCGGFFHGSPGADAPEDLFPPETLAEAETVRYEPLPEPDEEAPPPEPPDEKTPDDVVAEDVPDLNALFRICFHFWQMQPDKVCRQLGYKNQMDAHSAGINPWEAFLTIKRLKQEKKDHGAKEGC